MFIIDENRIYLTRADTADIDVKLENLDGSDYELQEGDTVVMRVKKYATKDSSELLIERAADIEDGKVTISLEPADTSELAFGDYRYEVELVTADNRHYTVIADTAFEIGKELENHDVN